MIEHLVIMYHHSPVIYAFSLCDICLQGWEEGEGLGKEKQGIKGHVRVKNKQDTTGWK